MNLRLEQALLKYAKLDDGVGELPSIKPIKPDTNLPLPGSPADANARVSNMPGAPGNTTSSVSLPAPASSQPVRPPAVGALAPAQPTSPSTPAFKSPSNAVTGMGGVTAGVPDSREAVEMHNRHTSIARRPPGLDPRLNAVSKGIEDDYNRLLTPEMRAQDSKDGFISAQLNQEQITARNNYKLYKSMASGNMEVNDKNLKLLQGPRGDASIWGEAIARSFAPSAMAVYDTAKGVSEGRGFLESANSAFSQAQREHEQYLSMFNDQLKRVANRYGGNFELKHEGDPFLDYGSYALEAVPSLLLGAATGGGSTALQAMNVASKVPGALRTAQLLSRIPGASQAGQMLVRGMSPFAQSSGSALGRYAGAAIPRVFNAATSVINPLQSANILRAALAPTSNIINAGNLLRSGVMSAMTPLLAQQSSNAYVNAVRDASHYNEVNPEASTMNTLGRFGQSLLGNVSFDPSTLAPGGIGRFISATGMSPSLLIGTVGQSFDNNLKLRTQQSYEALRATDPDRYAQLTMDPQQRKAFEDNIRLSMLDPKQYIKSQLQKVNPKQYAQLQADPEAMDKYIASVQKENPGLQGSGFIDSIGSVASTAAPYSRPGLRSLGAVGFREQDEIDRQAAMDASDNYLAAIAMGQDPMQNAKVQQAMSGASSLAKSRLASDVAQMVGSQALPALTGLAPTQISAALEAQDPSELMGTSLGAFAQGDPNLTLEAADTLYGLQQAMPLIQQNMAQTGQVSPEFIALVRAISHLQNSYQTPPSYGSQEIHPGMEAIRAMQPILQSIFEKQQQQGAS